MTAPARRPTLTLLVALVVGVVVASCSGAPHDDAVPKVRGGPTTTYVALGGDDVAGGRASFGSTWPHELLRTALPITTDLVDVSARRSGIAQIRSEQVPRAVAARPDLVTITLLDDAERGTDPDRVGADLDAALDALTARDPTRVLVGTVPDGAADATTVDGLNRAIRDASAHHPSARVVDLAAVGRADTPDGAVRTARAFGRALRALGFSPGRSP